MSEMIERVALEVARKRIGSKEPVPPEVITVWDRNTARAAIEAMREPTDEMCQTGLDTGAVDNDEFYLHPRDIKTVYVSMIDAALK